jgi:hypothetical protein
MAINTFSGGNFINSLQAAGKNAIINGGMDIWQRGTSSTAVGYGTADRWYQNNAGGTGTFAQETTTVPTGARYAMKFTASSSAAPQIHQYIETMQVIPLQGQTVTLSASMGASTSTAMGLDLAYTTSVDSGAGASWTTITPTSTTSGTSVTTYQRLNSVYSIPSTATSLRVRLYSVNNIANTVVVYFGNVQLELGSYATTFSRAGGTIQGELAACQRYYYQHIDANDKPVMNAGYFTAAILIGIIPLPVTMRTSPTISVTNGSIYWVSYSNGAADTFDTLGFGIVNPTAVNVEGTGNVSGTSGYAANIRSYNAGSRLGMSAEL